MQSGASDQQKWVRPRRSVRGDGARSEPPARGVAVADSSIVYAFLDDGPHRGETLRVTPEPGGGPPSTIELADPAGPEGASVTYLLLGPHQNEEWWIYRRARRDP